MTNAPHTDAVQELYLAPQPGDLLRGIPAAGSRSQGALWTICASGRGRDPPDFPRRGTLRERTPMSSSGRCRRSFCRRAGAAGPSCLADHQRLFYFAETGGEAAAGLCALQFCLLGGLRGVQYRTGNGGCPGTDRHCRRCTGDGDLYRQKGDTLWGIAKRYGVALTKLIAANPQIKNPNLIYPGNEVRIP